VRVGRRFSSAGSSRLGWLAGLAVAVALCQADASSSSSASTRAVIAASASTAAATAAEDYVVSLPVTVTDSGGRPVRGLSEQDFSVTEDGEPQTIRAFADKDIPLSLALIVDTSPAMRGPWMNDTFFAIRQLVTDAVGVEDEVSMWVFGRRPLELQAWTTKDGMLGSRYNIPDGGGAPLFETLSLVSKKMDKARHVRRVVIGVTGGTTSDGWRRDAGPAFAPPVGRAEPPSPALSMGNPWSPSAERERALKDLKSQNLLFYAIGLETPRRSENKVEPPPIDMNELRLTSEFTGGYVDQVKSTDDLVPALARVREELRSQYLIGYVSSRGQDGKPHEVKVTVKNPEHRVRARQSYTAKKR
jgi:Ca-activated chloride channel family protein